MKFFSKVEHLKVYHAKRKAMIPFVKGAYETNDQAEIDLLQTVDEIEYDPKELSKEDEAKGGEGVLTEDDVKKTIEDITPENVEPPEVVILATEEELEAMSATQLKAYAKDKKIAIPGKTRSTVDICAFIKEYQAEQEIEE